MKWCWFLACLLGTSPASANGEQCGIDQPCRVAGGEYFLAVPDSWDGSSALPAIMFYHGHRSSGDRVISSNGLREAFLASGYAIIAPNGAAREPDGVRAWPARPSLQDRRDDVAFSLAVIDDVAGRLPLDPNRLLVSGFSAGGSMAWMMACYQGQKFAGFVSVAGALRRPIPDGTCPAGPVRLLHIHGFTDKQVPLEGRAIRDWHQGSVSESLSLLRQTNKCRSNPDHIIHEPLYSCRHWTSCEGGTVHFCLHDGGHGMPIGWAQKAKMWFENGH